MAKGYRRSIFVIDRNFQFRFSIYVCSWLAVLSMIYPLIISNLFDYFLRFAAADPYGPAAATLENVRREMLWLLVLLQATFLAITFLISIFISHRIAGPLYKLKKYFAEAANGNVRDDLKFRKGDHFPELAEKYNHMASNVKAKLLLNATNSTLALERLEKALPHVDKAGRTDVEEAIAALREIKETVR